MGINMKEDFQAKIAQFCKKIIFKTMRKNQKVKVLI